MNTKTLLLLAVATQVAYADMGSWITGIKKSLNSASTSFRNNFSRTTIAENFTAKLDNLIDMPEPVQFHILYQTTDAPSAHQKDRVFSNLPTMLTAQDNPKNDFFSCMTLDIKRMYTRYLLSIYYDVLDRQKYQIQEKDRSDMSPRDHRLYEARGCLTTKMNDTFLKTLIPSTGVNSPAATAMKSDPQYKAFVPYIGLFPKALKRIEEIREEAYKLF